jgi:outer membrane protein W
MEGLAMSTFKAVIAIPLLAVPLALTAQTVPQPNETSSLNQPAARSLRGKHRIELGVGLMTELSASNQVSIGGVTTRNDATGIGGSLAYTHWLRDAWAINLSVGVVDADATVSVSGLGTSVESATVIPLLFGVRYQPIGLTAGDTFRPYVAASVGPYFGSVSGVTTGLIASTVSHSISTAETFASVSSYTETALGSRLGVGADILLGRRFTLGFGVGYCLVTDFENRIGSETNYSGPDLGLSFGILLGGSVAK